MCLWTPPEVKEDPLYGNHCWERVLCDRPVGDHDFSRYWSARRQFKLYIDPKRAYTSHTTSDVNTEKVNQ